MAQYRHNEKFVAAFVKWAREPLKSYHNVVRVITEPASNELFETFFLFRLGIINIAREHVNGRMNLTPSQKYVGEQCFVMAEALLHAFPDDPEIQDAWQD